MEYWQGVLSRVNAVGFILVLVGAALSFGAKKIVPLVFKNPDRMVLPLKFVGLAMVLAGALITLI